MDNVGKRENNLVKFEADDLIYNRFDLIYVEDVERYLYRYEDREFAIYVHYRKDKATLNIWGKQFPQSIFENVIDDIFKYHPEISCIDIKRAKNNYYNMLYEGNDILLSLPETVEQLLNRINTKSRCTLRRYKRRCEEKCGKLEVVLYNFNIPDEIVNQYFTWKRTTHGTDYHMSPKEYLQNYYVTDGILLKAGGRNIAVLFFCQVNHTAYLENLSYDTKMEKFSPGFLVYELFLEELIKRRCTHLYLGGGEYEYKRRFGAQVSAAYSGVIYRKGVFNALNSYFEEQGVKKIAIYGLGAIGHTFLNIVNLLHVDLVYGIDREEKQIEGLAVYTPEDDLKEVDAVIITLKFHNKEVEELLKSKFKRVYYWHDIAAGSFDGREG